MRIAIQKKTDQLNFEDFLGGITRIVTIAGVKKGGKESQYDIQIEEDTRVWRPPPTVLKLLVLAWGDDATQWVGRRVQLYGDPEVTMSGQAVGGIRVSHVSDIANPIQTKLTVTRGRKGTFTLQPLPDAPTPEQIAASSSRDELEKWWREYPNLRPAIEARGNQLKEN